MPRVGEAMMRPVEKGAAPKAYAVYQDAASDLRIRLGGYCSYCERRIETHLAVEHVQPKSRHGKLATAWGNLLLACVHCNSSKGNKRVALKHYFWPDRDNTLRAVNYLAGGLVQPSPALLAAHRAQATATIKLTGLDKYPGNPGREPTDSDLRWLTRREVWTLAQKYAALLPANNTQVFREAIVDVAIGRGMFSIWWTVFAADADVRGMLRSAFAGTCSDSFDANGHLKARAGGQL